MGPAGLGAPEPVPSHVQVSRTVLENDGFFLPMFPTSAGHDILGFLTCADAVSWTGRQGRGRSCAAGPVAGAPSAACRAAVPGA